MFLIWGSRWQYEIKSGGLRVQKKCPECDRTGEFIEVKPTKYFTLYFIPLIETESKRTVLECPHCKSHFYIPIAASRNQTVNVNGIRNIMVKRKREVSSQESEFSRFFV